jgi:hypothetical protein
MTADVLEVRRRLAAFSERPTAVSDAETRAERRERVVARIAEVLAEPVGAERRWARWPMAAGALALAAGAALVFGRWSTHHPESTALRSFELRGSVLCQNRSGQNWIACTKGGLGSGMGLKTLERAEAELETQAGVRLELESLGMLGLTEVERARTSTSVTLQQGRLSVRVPHLGQGREFSVVTPSATVVVHGTAFVVEVAKASDGRDRTCVRVTEGTVSVRHAGGEQWVSAGGSWGCDEQRATSSVELAPTPAPPSPASAPASPNSPRVTAGASERSTLGVEARLLRTALGAERRGDFDLAEKTLVSLLNSYPNSVVAPDAREALARIRRRQPDRH